MAAVNWERMSGERVEELATALVLSTRREGNRVTPSRGDKGIDIRIRTADGWEVYQVKRYSRPLTSKQAAEVAGSWETFVAEGVPALAGLGVASWNLAMPWDPTNERLDWLRRLTEGQPFPVNWVGRAQLDAMAAERPEFVDYYQGGADRVIDLMARAVRGGEPVATGSAGEALLEAVTNRQRALTDLLDGIDPFYRYTVEVRQGPLLDDWTSQVRPEDETATLVVYSQVDDDHHIATRITAKSAMAAVLRPIRHQVQFDVTDPGHREQVERFQRFGSPLTNVPAVAVSSSGPPGTEIPDGAELVVSMAAVGGSDLELELRLLDESGQSLAVLELTGIQVTHGDRRRGTRVVGSDESDAIRVEMLVYEGGSSELSLTTTSLAGKRATRALPAARFVEAMRPGTALQLAFVGGKTVGAPWQVGEVGSDDAHPYDRGLWARFVEALTVLQRHTYAEVRVPAEMTRGLYEEVLRIAKLLRGETLQLSASATASVTVTDPDSVTETEFAVMWQRLMAIELEGVVIETDRVELIHSPRARLVGGLPRQMGDTIQIGFDEAPTSRAVPTTAALPLG